MSQFSSIKCKKLVNDVSSCVDENIEGLLYLHPGLRVLKGHRVIVRDDLEEYKKSGKVLTLVGGGSGHEPFAAGYVGKGMMSGCVMGGVFAAPQSQTILAALRFMAKDYPGGIIMVYNNHTGDRLNFGIAMERAQREGIKVECILNADDCAVIPSAKSAGRRGIAGCIVMAKIVGALAEEGKSFEEILKFAKQIYETMGTLGVSLSPCSVPGTGVLFQIEADEMSIGLGLHGEAGVKNMKLMTARDTVYTMVAMMTDPESAVRVSLEPKDRVAVAINNLGGTSDLEINIIVKEVVECLESKRIKVERVFAGKYCSSQEMQGFSITILPLCDMWRHCLDAQTDAYVWIKPIYRKSDKGVIRPKPLDYKEPRTSEELTGPKVTKELSQMFYKCIHKACMSLISAEEKLNQLDSGCGDGDCGTTLKKGAEAILKHLGTEENPCPEITYPHSLLLSLANIVETSSGGSSGAFYSLFFMAASNHLLKDVSVNSWIEALKAGNEAISKYGGAVPGDRTMIDPLHAAQVSLESFNSQDPLKTFEKAVDAAVMKAKETSKMAARAGRASLVSEDYLKQPDPGAEAVAIWLQAIFEGVKETK